MAIALPACGRQAGDDGRYVRREEQNRLGLGDGVVPHVVGDLPVAVGLFPQNVQKRSFVRGAGGGAALHGGPGDFMSAPGVGDLAVADDILQSYNQLGYFRGRRVRREPEVVQSFPAYLGLTGVGRKQHAVVGKQGAYAVGVSAQPSFFIFFVHRSDLGDVIEGKRVLGKAENRAGEQEKQEGTTHKGKKGVYHPSINSLMRFD